MESKTLTQQLIRVKAVQVVNIFRLPTLRRDSLRLSRWWWACRTMSG